MLYMTDFLEKQLAILRGSSLRCPRRHGTFAGRDGTCQGHHAAPSRQEAACWPAHDLRQARREATHPLHRHAARGVLPHHVRQPAQPHEGQGGILRRCRQPALSRHARARLPGRLQHRTPGPVRRHDLYVQGPVHLRFVSRNGHLTRWLARGLQHGVHHARSRTRPGPAIPRGRRRAEAPAQASLRRWPLQGR